MVKKVELPNRVSSICPSGHPSRRRIGHELGGVPPDGGGDSSTGTGVTEPEGAGDVGGVVGRHQTGSETDADVAHVEFRTTGPGWGRSSGG